MTDALGDTAPRGTLPTGPGRSRTPRLILAANFALAGLLTVLSLVGLVGVTDPSAYVGTVLLAGSILPSNLLRFGRFSQGRRMRAPARLRASPSASARASGSSSTPPRACGSTSTSRCRSGRGSKTGILLGLVATLVFVLMLATSTGRAQRELGAHWKRPHRLVWFAVPLSLALVTGGLEPLAVVLYGGIMAFALFEYRLGAGTHLALVGAGTLASALIYAVL